MNALPTATVLARINARLERPISRALFEQSIRPAMAAGGYAEKIGSTWIFDGDWLPMWLDYLADRERRIQAGELPPKSPYSALDAEIIFHGQE